MMARLKIFLLISVFLSLVFTSSAYATSSEDIEDINYPWAVLFYVGQMTENTLGQVIIQDYQFNSETLYSLELSRELSCDNLLRHFLQPILSTVEVVGNVTYRDDPVGNIYEFNPYLTFRWRDFPWNNVVLTSLGLGEGLSYDTKVPQIEAENSDHTQGLLNFLLLEATAALPSYPQWEFVVRIHHRSGVFGLYDAGNNGSTAIGLGIRYRF